MLISSTAESVGPAIPNQTIAETYFSDPSPKSIIGVSSESFKEGL